MNTLERLAICQYCKNRLEDHATGVVCGLTMQKPDFENECPSYEFDEKMGKKDEARKELIVENYKKKDGHSISLWSAILLILALIRLVAFLARK
jgi:hypothetical protein